ncbi:MAG: DUF169 domain-containing protein [Chloroflexota bacterium]|nr:DUF169 domain-containing protein [Chloroflexota bacterium]
MDVKQIGETLSTYIRPQSFPVALKLCQSESEIPEKVRMPMRDLGYQIALCQAIGISRRYGWAMAIGNEDQCCLGGAITMGFTAEPPEGGFMQAPPEKKLEKGKYSYLLMAPVDTARFEPDIVVVYGNSAQIYRLVMSVSMTTGTDVSANASGAADCGDIVARTFLSNTCQFILPSGGDRVFGGTQDHEVIFTIPIDKVDVVLKALEDTHKAGFSRYPILVDLRHSPMLPPMMKIPQSA